MIFYWLYDGDELDRWFSTKAEAMVEAKDAYKYDIENYGRSGVTLKKVDIGKIDRAKVLSLLNTEGFVEKYLEVVFGEETP